MRVIHVNDTAVAGGATVAMLRLHHGLRRRAVSSTVLCRWRRPGQAAEGVLTIGEITGAGDDLLARLGRWLAARAERWLLLPDLHLSTGRLGRTPAWRQAHIVHLHNLHGEYFNYRRLPILARDRPLVWTLHDMWALTGYCTDAGDCARWQTGCFACPQIHGRPAHLRGQWRPLVDRSRAVWRDKARLYQQMRPHVVSPSRWLLERAQRSILQPNASFYHIPNSVDLERYRPVDRPAARAALGLPPGGRVVLFTAASAGNPMKGLAYLLEALARLSEPDAPWLLLAGEARGPAAVPSYPRCLALGRVDDDVRMNLAYNAADVLVLPSLAENHPLVLLEALAAGTPAVAFDVGGVREIVRHGETGYVAAPRDAADLARGMAWVLADPDRLMGLSRQSRRLAEQEFGLDRHVERYLSLYQALLEEPTK